MKRPNSNSLINKIVIIVLAIIVLTYLLFIIVPIIAVFFPISLDTVLLQFQNPKIVESIKLGLYTSTIATLISVSLTVPTAYFLVTRKFRGKVVIDTLIDISLVLPPAVAGIALLLAFAPKGLLGPILNIFGLTIPGSTIAVILAQVFVASPFVLRSSKTGFENVDKDVINSAKLLTSSRLRVFFTVTVPLSASAIISGAIMTWARAMGEFGATIMFAGNIPGITQTMPLAIYMLMGEDPYGSIVLSAILIVISFSILIVVKLLEQKRFGAKK